MSQGYCASRQTIYDQVQNQCCQFFKILIKKKSSCFLQRVVCVLLPRGCSYLQLEKIKTKKGLCTIQKNKN